MSSRIDFAVRDDSVVGFGFSAENRFGEIPVSPKRLIEFERDIWVVKCAALLRRGAIGFRRKPTLDHLDVARTIEVAVW